MIYSLSRNSPWIDICHKVSCHHSGHEDRVIHSAARTQNSPSLNSERDNCKCFSWYFQFKCSETFALFKIYFLFEDYLFIHYYRWVFIWKFSVGWRTRNLKVRSLFGVLGNVMGSVWNTWRAVRVGEVSVVAAEAFIQRSRPSHTDSDETQGNPQGHTGAGSSYAAAEASSPPLLPGCQGPS